MSRTLPRLVVGAAVVRRSEAGIEVLAAQRTDPPEVAGRWEFPGGKVEPGETPEEAVRRELAEELGIDTEVLGWLEGEQTVRADLVLRVAVVRVVGGTPVPREHRALRWVAVAAMSTVDWLDSDLPFVRRLMAAPAPSCAVFSEEESAVAAVSRLRSAGFEAAAFQQPFAGEDDDEDHAWTVRTDAPEAALERLCEELDGWLDAQPPEAPRPPLDLPVAPKRHHRPPAG